MDTKHGRQRRKGDRPEDDLLLAVIPILPKTDVEDFVNPRASIVGSRSDLHGTRCCCRITAWEVLKWMGMKFKEFTWEGCG